MHTSTEPNLRNQNQTQLQPPSWAMEMAGRRVVSTTRDGIDLTVARRAGVALISAHVADAIDLNAAVFEACVMRAYLAIRHEAGELFPARLWNQLPDIHQRMDNRNRYMVFNAARYQAMRDWLNDPDLFAAHLPAASGVGHGGPGLHIHCLALGRPGRAIENPRQVSSFHYSSQYGPVPPCFSRATMIEDPRDGQSAMLVAGTASIRGEQTVHPGDLSGQFDETLCNLRSLIMSAMPQIDLSAFTDVRVYYVRPESAAEIAIAARNAFGASAAIQMIRSQLCRDDLLVEIEGVIKPAAAGSAP